MARMESCEGLGREGAGLICGAVSISLGKLEKGDFTMEARHVTEGSRKLEHSIQAKNLQPASSKGKGQVFRLARSA